VLRRLSGTWTSLGYGIESNTMTARLPRIYQEILQEELENVPASGLPLRRG
jgi:muramidase (phage lysozyme)